MKIKRKTERVFYALIAFLLVFMLVPAEALAALDETDKVSERRSAAVRVMEIYEKTGAYLAGIEPGTGQTGGEWLVIGLARSKNGLSRESRDAYLAKLRKLVRENCNGENRLNANKSTENSRVVLALTSLLYNTGYFEGKDLLAGLSDMEYVKKQGINGSIWALIAFDSNNYEIPLLRGEGTQTTREGLLAEILNSQLSDGGFALAGETANADITAMALQALAPYYETREEVHMAVDKALVCLSGLQLAGGGYASWGEETMESNAQVLAALSSLGIDCRTDVRFLKNENTILDAILGFALEDGTFSHSAGGSETDLMATEQAYYALTAYYRLLEGEAGLYNMSSLEEAAQTGDANGDGCIDTDDALAVLKHAVGLKQEVFIKRAGNVDTETEISTDDALLVLKYAIGLITDFPKAE